MWIFPGTYTENTMSVTDINITGIEGSANTIIQAAIAPNIANARIFSTNGTVILTGLTMQNGSIVADGGAIQNFGSLTLNSSSVLNNFALSGGGIDSNALTNLSLNNSIIDGNTGGIQGGGVFFTGTLFDINNSTISNNTSVRAGGFWNSGGTLTMNYSTVSFNSATGNQSGGFENSGIATINNSTISNNSAASNGGGATNNSTLTINNSTFSNNTAVNEGAGLFNANGTTNLNYSTVSANIASSVAGGLTLFGGTINLQSSIVAGNQAAVPANADCNTSVVSLGYNLSGINTGCGLSGTGDINVVPATVFTTVLGPLANNGGPTMTHALLVGSPAINQIAPATNSCGIAPFDQDQRTEIRPFAINCDIGSYEAQ
jgi:hypothetical protein